MTSNAAFNIISNSNVVSLLTIGLCGSCKQKNVYKNLLVKWKPANFSTDELQPSEDKSLG